ncbi:MAG TPA: glycosyltransferase family 61 protein [Verrucomicrobiae bacterium]|jgi:hypothetical protein
MNRRFIPKVIEWGSDILRFLTSASRRFGPVSGCYSDLEELRRGGEGVEGRIILLDQGAPAVKPGSPMLLCKRDQHAQQPFPSFWIRRQKRRLIGPGLAHVNDRKQVSMESVYGARYAKSDPAYRFCPTGKPLRLEGPWMSLVSTWMPVHSPQPYAHWVYDALPRLAVLKELPPETRIIVPAHKTRYQVDSLEMLGLSQRCRWTTETHIEIEDYYFVSPPAMIVCYSPYTIEVMRAMFLPLADFRKPTPRRFFVRRSGAVRNMTNEAEVIGFFEKAGWTIVDLANVPFAEQIAWFAGAEAIAAIHGSGLANTVWAPHGCKILELFCDQYLAGDTEWTAQCVGAEYHSLIFPSDHRMSAIVDLDRVRATLLAARLL